MARRRVPEPVEAPADADPNRIVSRVLDLPRGTVRGWFKGGSCYRVSVAGRVYGWGEGPAVWAAVLDGSFRPDDFGKHNR